MLPYCHGSNMLRRARRLRRADNYDISRRVDKRHALQYVFKKAVEASPTVRKILSVTPSVRNIAALLTNEVE